VFGELIDQRAFAGSGRSSHAEDSSLAGVREKSFKQIGPAGGAVFDHRDSACKGAWVAGADTFDKS
jgi:hypothetical protein